LGGGGRLQVIIVIGLAQLRCKRHTIIHSIIMKGASIDV